ncbi:hypothetical protein C0992_013346 [Termitomyces sp. T32_za158]|nr:hypothetical protein C0992_013346 [Termitomyces sp. T32_za158]
MMGYASLEQIDTGLHMRQRSRAFIVAEAASPSNRVVFVNAGMEPWSRLLFSAVDERKLDIAMGDTGVRRSVISQLETLYAGLYTATNVAFVGTHQHSGVGGYLENLLPQVTSLGYVKETADAIVEGTVLAVKRAHANLAPGKLSVGNTTIFDANINRSPTAYLANPAAEREKYQYDQDKEMTVLRFDDENGNARGLLSFFAVHGTSLYELMLGIRVPIRLGRFAKVQEKIMTVFHAMQTIPLVAAQFKTATVGQFQMKMMHHHPLRLHCIHHKAGQDFVYLILNQIELSARNNSKGLELLWMGLGIL